MDSAETKRKNIERVTKWRKENPEKVKAYQAKYREKNLERIKAHMAKYDKERRDPEKVKARVIQWKKDNPEKVKEWAKRYYATEKGKASKAKSAEIAKAKRLEYAKSVEGIAKKSAWQAQLSEWAATKKDRRRIVNKRQYEARRARDIAAGKVLVRTKMTHDEKKEARATARRNRKAMERNAVGKLSKGIRKSLYLFQKGKCPACRCKLVLDGAKKCHIDHVIPLSAGGSNTDDNVQLLCPECNVSKGARESHVFMQSKGFLI